MSLMKEPLSLYVSYTQYSKRGSYRDVFCQSLLGILLEFNAILFQESA